MTMLSAAIGHLSYLSQRYYVAQYSVCALLYAQRHDGLKDIKGAFSCNEASDDIRLNKCWRSSTRMGAFYMFQDTRELVIEYFFRLQSAINAIRV